MSQFDQYRTTKMIPQLTALQQKERNNRLHALEDDTSLVDNFEILRHKKQPLNPRRLLGLTFFLLIFFGGALLCTPWARVANVWPGMQTGIFQWSECWRTILDNIFMATSASCVTGLTVVSVPEYYTTFGQIILLMCIQLGGIGLITLGTFIVSLLLGRLSSSAESQVMMNYGVSVRGKANTLLWQTMRYVFSFEIVGILILTARYSFAYGYDFFRSFWYATFHSISAFCNAGLSLHDENLIFMADDPIYMATITFLVIAGGIGFLVISNLFHYQFWRRDLKKRGRISLHSRIVLWATAGLLVFGGLLFAILEWNHSLGENTGLSFYEALRLKEWHVAWETLHLYFVKFLRAFAQSAMFRTAGFNFVDIGEVTPSANLLSIILMLIGGSPGSMAGGIKTTTLIVLFLTIRAYVRGAPEVQVYRRTISDSICREAMVLFVFYLMMVCLFYFILNLTENLLLQERGHLALFYEVSSAFGTVGTSVNATNFLTATGKVVISLAMFLGRIGPLSIALMMAGHKNVHRVRYPEESVSVG